MMNYIMTFLRMVADVSLYLKYHTFLSLHTNKVEVHTHTEYGL